MMEEQSEEVVGVVEIKNLNSSKWNLPHGNFWFYN